MSGGKCCFGKPKLVCAKVPDASFKLVEPVCVTQRQKVLSGLVWQIGSFGCKSSTRSGDDIKTKSEAFQRIHILVI